MGQMKKRSRQSKVCGFGEDSVLRSKVKQATIKKLKEKLRPDLFDRAELETVAAGLFHLWFKLKPYERDSDSVSDCFKTFLGGSMYNLMTEIARVINTIDLLLSENCEYGYLKSICQKYEKEFTI